MSTITLNQLLTFEVIECYSCATSFALTVPESKRRAVKHYGSAVGPTREDTK